jgi:hypothetical protein
MISHRAGRGDAMTLEIVLVVLGVCAAFIGIGLWLVRKDPRYPDDSLHSRNAALRMENLPIRFKTKRIESKDVGAILEVLKSDVLAEVKKLTPEVVEGAILWNPPDRMKVGRREIIEVRLGDATVAEAALREGLRGRGTPYVDRLEVEPFMRVVLVGETGDFSIQEMSERDQHVRPGRVTRWDFSVTPLRSGTRRLRLRASIRIKIEGSDEMADLPSYEREVKVGIAPVHAVGQFFSKNWQWVGASVAIPSIVWVVKDTDVGKTALKHLWGWLGTG